MSDSITAPLGQAPTDPAPQPASTGASIMSDDNGHHQAATPAELPTTVAALEPDAEKLGMRVRGSAKTGHQVRMREGTLEKIFGTDEPFQANAFLTQCFATLTNSEAGNSGEHNDMRPFVISIVKDIGAKDAVERMLAVQMAATHVALIRAGRGMAAASMLPQLEAYTTAYNKLARTYAAQMEALRKHRNGGQQKVRVEHVHVHPGGQAIVGEVHHGGRGAEDER